MNIDEIIDNFQFLENWEDKYLYIIELGNEVPKIENKERIKENLVQGCQSRVWLVCDKTSLSDNKLLLKFRADSDSQIVKGLVAITLSIFSEKSPDEIIKTDPFIYFTKMELEKHLSSNRSNGLQAMVNKIKEYAGIFVN